MAHNNSTNSSELNQTDSDDWTLISPAASSEASLSSSPEHSRPEDILSLNDGLHEIDLRDASDSSRRTKSISLNRRGSSPDFIMPGFQAVETSDEYALDESLESSRRSSITQSELGEFVDLGKHGTLEQFDKEEQIDGKESRQPVFVEQAVQATDGVEAKETRPDEYHTSDLAVMLKKKMDELSDVADLLSSNRRLRDLCQIPHVHSRRPITRQWLVLHLIVLSVHVGINHLLINHRQSQGSHQTHQPEKRLRDNLFEKLYRRSSESVIPTSQHELKLELQLLQNELAECIKRQSPTSYKYYLADAKDVNNPRTSAHKGTPRPYKGLVCYGQESHWRKRFERVRKEFNLDLNKLISEAKRRVTNEMLEFHHPALQFKLIVNQIEYLDFIESKRKTKQYEETIKYLRGENLRLTRLTSDRERSHESHISKRLVTSLENEKVKLLRQIETLKTSLSMKAGPTYMKQSLELERYSQENDVLKKFHLELAHDISRNLKLFQQHTVDAFGAIDDQKSLNTQISSTRAYMQRLSGEISQVLVENDELKEELRDVTNELLSMATPDTAAIVRPGLKGGQLKSDELRPVTLSGYIEPGVELESFCSTADYQRSFKHYNASGGLLANNCLRELKESRNELNFILNELNRLRRECSTEIEQRRGSLSPASSGDSAHLSNLSRGKEASVSTSETKPMAITNGGLSKRVADLIDNTVFDKPDSDNENKLILKSALMDAIILLEKFNVQGSGHWRDEMLKLFAEKLRSLPGDLHKFATTSKVLPNYIREAKREKRAVTQSSANPLVELPSQQNYLASTLGNVSFPSHNTRATRISDNRAVAPATETVGNSTSQGESSASQLPDSWFFKRAKQRGQLRYRPGSSLDWMLKRAKLGEKLSAVPLCIANNYIASNVIARGDFIRSQDESRRENSLNNSKQQGHTGSVVSQKHQKAPRWLDEESLSSNRNRKAKHQQQPRKKRKGKQRSGQRRKHRKCRGQRETSGEKRQAKVDRSAHVGVREYQ